MRKIDIDEYNNILFGGIPTKITWKDKHEIDKVENMHHCSDIGDAIIWAILQQLDNFFDMSDEEKEDAKNVLKGKLKCQS